MIKFFRCIAPILVVFICPMFISPFARADEKEIAAILQKQTDAWNRQDIDGFMQTYWKSGDLTFSSGGTTTRGWQATLDRYKKKYHPPDQMGKLSFDELEVTMLNESSAFVLGRWHLKIGDERQNGNFTLVVKKIDGQWLIVHDHSSIEEEN